MLPLLYVGIISFFTSFSITNVITREYLRSTYENKLNKELYKKKSLVKFNKYIRVKKIPSLMDLSYNSFSELWYNKYDYELFNKEYILFKKFNSL
jgi:hypothetical protein